MCKTLKALSLTIVLSACLIVSAAAKDTVTKINDLIDSTKTYDQQVVTVEGEAIGEVLERGSYSWVNIHDGTNAIGIWMKTSDADSLEYFGDYKHIGDTIQITGVFSRDCTEHGGYVDIHCSSFEIVKPGHSVAYTVSQTKAIGAAVLACVALLVAYIYRKAVKKRKSID